MLSLAATCGFAGAALSVANGNPAIGAGNPLASTSWLRRETRDGGDEPLPSADVQKKWGGSGGYGFPPTTAPTGLPAGSTVGIPVSGPVSPQIIGSSGQNGPVYFSGARKTMGLSYSLVSIFGLTVALSTVAPWIRA